MPGNNVIYADAKGNAGLAPSGNAPRRPNWDGLFPVAGDGRYEWDGIRPNDELPRYYNPPEGFVASANNAPYFVKEDKLAAMKLGYEFSADGRIDRIREVLGGNAKVSFDKALALQNDYVSIQARRRIPLLKQIDAGSDAKLGEAIRLLVEWNQVMAKESGAAALYAIWSRNAGRPEPGGEALRASLVKAVVETERLLGADWSQWQWGKLHRRAL